MRRYPLSLWPRVRPTRQEQAVGTAIGIHRELPDGMTGGWQWRSAYRDFAKTGGKPGVKEDAEQRVPLVQCQPPALACRTISTSTAISD